MKQREIFQTPNKTSKIATGFNLDADSNMKYYGNCSKISRKPKGQERTTLKEWLFANLKVYHNIVSLTMKTFFENLLHYKPPADFLDNLKNPSMNNILSIDYVNKDFTHDTDQILSRWTQEYPRISSEYKSLISEDKPWGEKSEPVFFDYTIDSRLRHSFDTGIWYYTSLS